MEGEVPCVTSAVHGVHFGKEEGIALDGKWRQDSTNGMLIRSDQGGSSSDLC